MLFHHTKIKLILLLSVSFLLALSGNSLAVNKYAPTWESVTQHDNPEWFRDAKFGIYFHWGIYSVPAFGDEWYPHFMYNEKNNRHDIFKHHIEVHGGAEKFGYKDFLPMFKAEKFDPDSWAKLFKKSGARFAGPVAEHADGFAMWDSDLTKWDAKDMGPKRDIVGDLEKAIRKQGIKFITTFHHQWLWAWYPTYDERYDTSNPEYAGLYGPKTKPGDFKNPKPDDEFCQLWLNKVKEVVDNYQPDLLWFDSRTNKIGEKYRCQMLAHYYNRSLEWGKDVGVTYKNKDLAKGAGILDIERGRMSTLSEFEWLNDDSIDWKTWCHDMNPNYKSANRLIDGLVDIVSKNGNLLLNITPKANGEIPLPVQQRLLEIGKWLDLNGQAIYETRPWVTFGEGPTEVKQGHFTEKHIGEFTAEDIRFSVRYNEDKQVKSLYAIVLDWPANGSVLIESLSKKQKALGKIESIEMIGSDANLKWSRTADNLKIKFPSTKPCDHAFVLKITGEISR